MAVVTTTAIVPTTISVVRAACTQNATTIMGTLMQPPILLEELLQDQSFSFASSCFVVSMAAKAIRRGKKDYNEKR